MEIQSQGTIFRALNASPRRIHCGRINTKGALVTSEVVTQQHSSGCNGERKQRCATSTSLNTMKKILLRSFQGKLRGNSFTSTSITVDLQGHLHPIGVSENRSVWVEKSSQIPHPTPSLHVTTSPRATSPWLGGTSDAQRWTFSANPLGKTQWHRARRYARTRKTLLY